MTAVIDQVKKSAYASVGVNLLVTDAIVGREVPAPDFAEEHVSIARKEATKALTEFRARTEPQAAKIEARLPEQVADVLSTNRTKAWTFIGIDAPKAKTATKTAAKPAAKKAPARARKTTKKTAARKTTKS